MRHFRTLTEEQGRLLFSRLPESFDGLTPRDTLAYALGATLYTPGTYPDLVGVVCRRGRAGLTSMVVCLEDAIPDSEVEAAHVNLARALGDLRGIDPDPLPLLFARVRTPGEIQRVLDTDAGNRLTGFVFPKFGPGNGDAWYAALGAGATEVQRPLFGMPVLESAQLLDPLLRAQWLHDVHDVIRRYPERTLAVRIGSADILGLLGLRRDASLTSYSIGPLRDAISAIVGIFGVDRSNVPAITGSVWEHFRASPRSFRPQLRSTVFHDRGADLVRDALLELGLDVLAEELAIDRAHGLAGKTAIHPMQVPIINAWQAVPHEEYADAVAVLKGEGASASAYSNKMNEAKPHRPWAEQTILRARAAGVLAPGITWVDLLLAIGNDLNLVDERPDVRRRAQ